MRAYAERTRIELRRDISLAWYTAAFSRAKKLPSLETTLGRIREPASHDKRPMTWQEIAAAARAWTKHLGGRIVKKG